VLRHERRAAAYLRLRPLVPVPSEPVDAPSDAARAKEHIRNCAKLLADGAPVLADRPLGTRRPLGGRREVGGGEGDVRVGRG
jgi:hypothetical protein